MKNRIIFALFILFSTSSCRSQNSDSVETLEVKTYSEKLNSTDRPQLIDVRTPEEFADDHLKNAININWLGQNFKTDTEKFNKSKPIFVYCKVGGRSAKAANQLAEMGFTKIYNLEGGIMKWNAANMGKKSDKIVGICSQEYNELISKDQKTIVNFYAKWCEPCKKMQPYILKMQNELKGKINLIRLDADENKTILEELKCDGLPVILIYENGKEVYRHIGLLNEDELKKQLQ